MKIRYEVKDMLTVITSNLKYNGKNKVIFHTPTKEKLGILLNQINKISKVPSIVERNKGIIRDAVTRYEANTCIEYDFYNQLSSYADLNFYKTHKEYIEFNIIEL